MNVMRKVVEVSGYIYRTGLVSGIGGNVSAKQGDEVIITPTMVPLGDVSLRNLVIVDVDGSVLRGKGPSSELELHLEIYRRRPDIGGIVHTHSPCARAFSMAGVRIMKMEGFRDLGTGHIPMVPYHPPGSTELAEACAEGMLKEKAVVLENHGIVCGGSDLDEALLLAEFVEESARTQFIASMLGMEK